MASASKIYSPQDFEDSYNGVVFEYVYNMYNGFDTSSKIRVVEKEPKTPEECPMWDNYAWDDVKGDMDSFKLMLLKPVALFDNPFLKRPHKLVMCELWLTPDIPGENNSRYKCRKTMERLHTIGKEIDPWFGIEQEYFITDKNNIPISYQPESFNYETMIIYAKVNHPHDKNMGSERQLADTHLMACIYAGIKIFGTMRENCPSQWEYQIGPCPGESIGDHLNMSRYILCRLAENANVRINFRPMPIKGTSLTSGGHLNFSTRQMREKGGKRFIEHAVKLLQNSDEEILLKMYDPAITEENKERLTESKGLWHPRIDNFLNEVGNKTLTTIRIPPLVDINGCGYLEERRPSSAIDPYSAADGIVRASILGDFLKIGYEHLKTNIYAEH